MSIPEFQKQLAAHLTNCWDEEISSSSAVNRLKHLVTNCNEKLEEWLELADIVKTATKAAQHGLEEVLPGS